MSSPCWWFASAENVQDVRVLLARSEDLQPDQIVSALLDALTRSLRFKPELAPHIQAALQEFQETQRWQDHQRKRIALARRKAAQAPSNVPVFPFVNKGLKEPAKKKRRKYKKRASVENFKLKRWRLSQDDVWAGSSSWWLQARKIADLIHALNL